MLPVVTRDWFAEIDKNAVLAHFVLHKPRLLLKLQRPYLNRHYRPRARLNALVAHYEFLARTLSNELIDRLANGDGLCLARVATAGGRDYNLRLSGTDTFDREGELLLTLEQDVGRQRVACIAFSVTHKDGRPQLEIGCLQGATVQAGKELIKQSTKDLHGLRPKNLLLDALYALAQSWGIPWIVAIDNGNRIYRSGNADSNQVFADYDCFWRELGGVQGKNGQFLLPAQLVHRPPAAVASSRRAEYRRRQDLRESVTRQLWIQLALTVRPVMLHNNEQHGAPDMAIHAPNLGNSMQIYPAAPQLVGLG